jgi:hypothetical protein
VLIGSRDSRDKDQLVIYSTLGLAYFNHAVSEGQTEFMKCKATRSCFRPQSCLDRRDVKSSCVT